MSIKAIKEYNSIFEMVEDVKTPHRIPAKFPASRREGADQDWDMGVGFNGAVKLGLEGWVEGTKAIEEARDKIYGIMAPRIKHQEVEYALDGGAFVDVGRFCAGEPECFGVFHEIEKIQNRPLTIVVNSSTSGGTTGIEIRNRGAAIVAAVDVLEQCGYSCEVILVNCIRKYGRGQEAVVWTVIKRAGEVVDLDSFAFALTHPAFLRRITFGAKEKFEPEDRHLFGFGDGGGGYGSPAEYMHEDRDLYFGTLKPHDRIWKSIENSANAIMGMLEKYGLISEDESER